MGSQGSAGGSALTANSLWGPSFEVLGLLLSIGFAPGDVSWFDLERKFPQGLLCEVIAEVVEERDDVIIPLQFVVSTTSKKQAFIGH